MEGVDMSVRESCELLKDQKEQIGEGKESKNCDHVTFLSTDCILA